MKPALASTIAKIVECARFRYFAALGLVPVLLWSAIGYALITMQRELLDRARTNAFT